MNKTSSKKDTKESDTTPTKYLAFITAFTTNVRVMNIKTATMEKSNGETSKNSNSNGNLSHNITDWRDDVSKDGKHYNWREKHNDGNGLYVIYHPFDHGKDPKDFEHTQRNG